MRERILDAIYKKIEEDPTNTHLQRQITLLNKSSICTIHSFCLDVIRNYFYEIDTSANFRLGEEAEIELLKQEVLEDIFEEKYVKKEKGFLDLIDTYTTYRDDEPLKELILKIEKYIQSNPFPEEWLKEKIEMFNLREKIDEDFETTIWGKILLDELKNQIQENISKLEYVKRKLNLYDELQKYADTIESDIEKLRNVVDIINSSKEGKWDKVVTNLNNMQFEKWPINKKVTIQYKGEAKKVRDTIKKELSSTIQKKFIILSKQANQDIYAMYKRLKYLEKIIIEFEECFSKKKKEKNIIDFHDIEHFALKILVKKQEVKNMRK